MKKYVKSGIYKASNVTFDPNIISAVSYGWWHFVKVIEGKVVFNSYRYSMSTGGHQRKVKELMSKLRIRIAVEVSFPNGLQEVKTIKQAEKLHKEHLANLAEAAELNRKCRNEQAREKRAAYKEELRKIEEMLAAKRAAAKNSSQQLVDMLDIKKVYSPEEAEQQQRHGGLPDNSTVSGSLYISGRSGKILPDNLEVYGDLDLQDSKIRLLPLGLKVNGNLILRGSFITKLPPDMKIGGRIIGNKKLKSKIEKFMKESARA